ncbi:HAMP domain-containing methyl-accepting chemotaxis protein [Pseudomonas sp. S1_E04]
MSLRNMRIGLRASLSFGVLASLLVIAGLFGLGQMAKLCENALVIEPSRMPTHDSAALVASIRLEALLNSDAEQALLDKLKGNITTYLDVVNQMVALVDKHQQQDAIDLLTHRLAPQGKVLGQNLEHLIAVNRSGVEAATGSAARVYSSARWVVGLIIVIALLATLLLAWLLTRSITAPINQARSMRGISESAQQLACAAEEMSSVLQQSTRGLQAQNHEIEQAATAVTQMSAAVDEVASNAVSSAEASQASDEDSKHGHYQISETIRSIQNLVDEVLAATHKAEDLALQAQNISKVLEVIRNIAGQTNLLALNAAIEAARAGDAGRGFAVVADEVRSFAQRTQDSAEAVEQMLTGIQQGTQDTVMALNSSAEQAGHTLQRANSAASALEKITAAISQISQRNRMIASAAGQLALVAREVDRSLVNIRDLSMQTAAGATQTSAASQELSHLAVDLNGLVTRFVL